MRVVISNFSPPIDAHEDYVAAWADAVFPEPPANRLTLFDQRFGWGFHLTSIGVHLMDQGVAERVEFWDYDAMRRLSYMPNGVLRATFHNERDVAAYVERFGAPDLFINHGVQGVPVVRMLTGRTFRVHVPTRRTGHGALPDADCFLVDAVEQLDDRSMLYIPVVNTAVIRPGDGSYERDFVYLAWCRAGKRHDLIVDAVRGTELTGHLHPVSPSALDLSGTHITTSNEDELDVVALLQSSRIAVYPGDRTSNPAAMWECVAADLPIVVNDAIEGGKHLVVPGVTGELAPESDFLDVMLHVLSHRSGYSPREYFEEHWDTVSLIEQYLDFFQTMGWRP